MRRVRRGLLGISGGWLLVLGVSPGTPAARAASAAREASMPQEASAPPERRSPEGAPATAWKASPWQQGVRYTIEARLEEERGVLVGTALLEYRNMSPDSLDRLAFHLYLNAFRPNSLWARTERRSAYDFPSLRDPDFGYERLRGVWLLSQTEGGPGGSTGDGGGATGQGGGTRNVPLRSVFPHAPDSTVVEIPLPEPLPPGAGVALRLEWEARPSTLCRRQCRRGRHFDFAQWYPRIAVYDAGGWQAHPLYPQGEFYGEFATYDVTLEVPEDQVIGATGVPVFGDPGWRPAPGSPRSEPLYAEDAYGEPPLPPPLGLLPASGPPAGWKRVRFRAERVHHFAWSADPEFRYEGGQLGPTAQRNFPVAVHVLYRPGDEESWGGGRVVQRTIEALAWLEDVFGAYPWPQLTNLHRLEGGGTEFPMLVMNGAPSFGLIVHETAHQYVHGIFANNEWKEAWLDEGFASFLDAWYFEERGLDGWKRAVETVAEWDREGRSQPVATVSEEFRDFATYGAMVYTKGSLIFRMLRDLLGEPGFREVLREYYRRYRLSHVDEAAFRRVAEEVSGRDLSGFFDPWLHDTATLDYALADVRWEPLDDGRFRVWVTVERRGEAWAPVRLRVGSETRVLESRAPRQTVQVEVSGSPDAVELDPDFLLPDVDRGNNVRPLETGPRPAGQGAEGR